MWSANTACIKPTLHYMVRFLTSNQVKILSCLENTEKFNVDGESLKGKVRDNGRNDDKSGRSGRNGKRRCHSPSTNAVVR